MVIDTIVAALHNRKIALYGVGCDAHAILTAHVFLGGMVYLRVLSLASDPR